MPLLVNLVRNQPVRERVVSRPVYRGHVSHYAAVLWDLDGTIIDLFGSVINTCTKMNKMASPNTCIAGEVLHEKLVALGIVNAEQGSTDEKVVSEKIGDYHIGDKLSFGVWQIAK